MDREMASKDPSVGPQGVVPDLRVRTVVGVFERREQAEQAYQTLQVAGFGADDLSLVQRGEGGRRVIGVEQTHVGHTTVAGVSAGVVLGGIAGLVALAIPGIGPLLAVGPIAIALGGAGVGGALGGLVGSFVGLGIPNEQARAYEEAVRQGGVVLAVKASNGADADRAESILRERGAREAVAYTTAM